MSGEARTVSGVLEVTEPVAGATVDLPHDRMTIERFRQAFPRARWSEHDRAWFVPGRTALTRIGRFLAKLEADENAFADAKGRDAFDFNPIESRYLTVGSTGLLIHTPYSRTLVSMIRDIPGARWDSERRLWTVPYRSYEDLYSSWPSIEAIAAQCEPEARKERQESLRGTVEGEATRARLRERRRKRYPVALSSMPPTDRAVSTHAGVVYFSNLTSERADRRSIEAFYFPPDEGEDYVWCNWRAGTLRELVETWPSRSDPTIGNRQRGWWLPTLDELRIARRDARSREKASQRRFEDAATNEGTISI